MLILTPFIVLLLAACSDSSGLGFASSRYEGEPRFAIYATQRSTDRGPQSCANEAGAPVAAGSGPTEFSSIFWDGIGGAKRYGFGLQRDYGYDAGDRVRYISYDVQTDIPVHTVRAETEMPDGTGTQLCTYNFAFASLVGLVNCNSSDEDTQSLELGAPNDIGRNVGITSADPTRLITRMSLIACNSSADTTPELLLTAPVPAPGKGGPRLDHTPHWTFATISCTPAGGALNLNTTVAERIDGFFTDSATQIKSAAAAYAAGQTPMLNGEPAPDGFWCWHPNF